MKDGKIWSILCIVLTLLMLLGIGTATAVIDPFFHYHAPLEGLEYPLDNQRYQNDGIVRHFDYDAMITGTSMTENFKTSEMDALFGVKAIKVSYSGGDLGEIVFNLRRALEANPNIQTVIFGMEEWFLLDGRDLILADGEYPTYLYDEDPFNDVRYLLNKEVFLTNTLGVLNFTAEGNTTTSFDDYGSWTGSYGREAALASYYSYDTTPTGADLTSAEVETVERNMRQTLLALAQDYPDTEFICFFPPYSVLDWYLHLQQRSVKCFVDAFSLATQVLLERDNIRVFSFYTDYETVTDLSNYRDVVHYSDSINSLLLRRFVAGEYELTRENARSHWAEVQEYYENFDYEGLLAS